jgi:mycofactocin system glycosyltransferase
VIPLQYRLRESIRLEPATAGNWRVICESPLSVLTVNEAAARLLKRARHAASVADLATGFSMAEDRVFSLCEHFRRRGILEVGRTPGDPAFSPTVTVIVPTLERAGDLDDCLRALAGLDYPADQFELIVVDDGSADAAAIAGLAGCHGARLLVNDHNQGPSYSRNRAAGEATGDILAFVDSDCVASAQWLRELVAYLAWDRVGAVGGRTTGYYTESSLDRYEAVASPLDMGRHLRLESRGSDTFYVPTCNLLVRRSVYLALDGLREDLRMGEDVDFCWRLRARGDYLVYAPEGIVRHKHRNTLVPMLRRRAGYGSSEAGLYALHPDKRKRLPLEPAPLATVALLSAAAIGRRPHLLAACLVPALLDAARRTQHLRENEIDVPARRVLLSVARGHLSMLYFAYFHVVRYYLGPLAAAGVVSRAPRRFAALAALYAGTVDYVTKRPRLGYLSYLGYYLAEHAAYQAGVFAGCVRAGTFRSYRLAIEQDRAAPLPTVPSPARSRIRCR